MTESIIKGYKMKAEELETNIIEKIEIAMCKQKLSKTSKERMFYLGQRVAYQYILAELSEV